MRGGNRLARFVLPIVGLALAVLLAVPSLAQAQECLNVRTGEPLDCDDLGAVTQEIYEESSLRDDETAASPETDNGGNDGLIIAVAVGGVALLSLGALLLLRRRKRSDHRSDPVEQKTLTVEPKEPKVSQSEATQPAPKPAAKPGWYDYHGGKRFWDGSGWTDAYAYVTPRSSELGFWELVGAITFGIIGGLTLLRIGADLAPDLFFVPTKFVVDPNDLPPVFR